MIKIFLFSLSLLFTLHCFAETVRDTVVIEDLWIKKDIAEPDSTLKKALPAGQEMQILEAPASTQPSPKVKFLSSKNESRTTVSHEDDKEIKMFGKNRFRHSQRYRWRFSGHWCGVNFGFVNFANVDYSDYAPSEDGFMDLDYVNSFVMQLNIFQQSINLVPRNNFGLVIGLGLEYQRLRFDNKHRSIALNEDKKVVPWEIDPEWNVKKNSFKTLYLTIPLLMEVQFPALRSQQIYISAGVMGGVRLHSKTKIVYNNQNGNKKKDKVSDDFSMIPVKADAIARIGYRGLNVWGSYTLTRMFKSGKGPELHPYSIGLGITF